MVASDGMVHFLKIEKINKSSLPKLSCGFKHYYTHQQKQMYNFVTYSKPEKNIGTSAFP